VSIQHCQLASQQAIAWSLCQSSPSFYPNQLIPDLLTSRWYEQAYTQYFAHLDISIASFVHLLMASNGAPSTYQLSQVSTVKANLDLFTYKQIMGVVKLRNYVTFSNHHHYLLPTHDYTHSVIDAIRILADQIYRHLHPVSTLSGKLGNKLCGQTYM